MKTKLEILQDALAGQQRYLRFLDGSGTRVLFGFGFAAIVVSAVSIQLAAPEALPVILLIPVVLLGGLIAAAVIKAALWLCRKLAHAQIADYRKAIEQLERDQ